MPSTRSWTAAIRRVCAQCLSASAVLEGQDVLLHLHPNRQTAIEHSRTVGSRSRHLPAVVHCGTPEPQELQPRGQPRYARNFSRALEDHDKTCQGPGEHCDNTVQIGNGWGRAISDRARSSHRSFRRRRDRYQASAADSNLAGVCFPHTQTVRSKAVKPSRFLLLLLTFDASSPALAPLPALRVSLHS